MIGFELPFVSWIFHDERPRVTRARERETPSPSFLSLPFPSLLSYASVCQSMHTRRVYRLQTTRHPLLYLAVEFPIPIKGTTFSEKFLSMEIYHTVFFSCEKYEYIRRKMLVVHESFIRIIGSKIFFKNIYISFELKLFRYYVIASA